MWKSGAALGCVGMAALDRDGLVCWRTYIPGHCNHLLENPYCFKSDLFIYLFYINVQSHNPAKCLLGVRGHRAEYPERVVKSNRMMRSDGEAIINIIAKDICVC